MSFIKESVLSPLYVLYSFVIEPLPLCLVLFLGPQFCSVALCVCSCASSILFWFLSFCRIVWCYGALIPQALIFLKIVLSIWDTFVVPYKFWSYLWVLPLQYADRSPVCNERHHHGLFLLHGYYPACTVRSWMQILLRFCFHILKCLFEMLEVYFRYFYAPNFLRDILSVSC